MKNKIMNFIVDLWEQRLREGNGTKLGEGSGTEVERGK